MFDAIVVWDEPGDSPNNTAHVAEHGLTPEEVEDVLLDDSIPVEVSSTSGRAAKRGWTSTGRHVFVPFDVLSEDPLVIYPVTAYEIDP